jgi:hypothetical protein
MSLARVRDRIDGILGAGLRASGPEVEAVAAELDALGLRRPAELLRRRDVDSVAQAIKALDLVRVRTFEPARVDLAMLAAAPGSLRMEATEVPRGGRLEPGEPGRYFFSVAETCRHAPPEELRRLRTRIWSDSAAAPFAIAALRERPKIALGLVEPLSNPVAGRTAVRLCEAIPGSDDALKRLRTSKLPVSRWAEDALAERAAPAVRDAYLRSREARHRYHAEVAKTACWAATYQERAWAVAELGQTRDPIFAPDLRRAMEDPVFSVRHEAAIALAWVGDDAFVEEWIEAVERSETAYLRPLGILREARGLAALVDASIRGLNGVFAALEEAGADGIEAALDRLEREPEAPIPGRLFAHWKVPDLVPALGTRPAAVLNAVGRRMTDEKRTAFWSRVKEQL